MMKNKIELKKYLKITLFVSSCLFFVFLLINIYEYRTYTKNFNEKLSAIIAKIEDKYPDITKNEIMEILNNDTTNNDIFKDYGIDVNKDAIIQKNDKNYHQFLVINVAFLMAVIIVLVMIFITYIRNKDKKISEITKYIEEINRRNYSLHLDEISEDELSILKNEIYKTTIMLKESAINSLNDKKNLKKSLEDISHQLKTPLTSILIMLDNLIDDPKMDEVIRNDFIKDIKREIVNINFLVGSILKLSKFESNTINFIREEVSVKKIIDEAIKNVSNLCDLKNVKIEVENKCKTKINCDYRWQVEALTNIIKNAVEYSKESSKVIIECNENNVYSQIKIKDFGVGMDEEDVLNIFKRFYKGKDAGKDSIGIGLALSKVIIEEDNGRVSVESKKEKGTTFTIKYFYNK